MLGRAGLYAVMASKGFPWLSNLIAVRDVPQRRRCGLGRRRDPYQLDGRGGDTRVEALI